MALKDKFMPEMHHFLKGVLATAKGSNKPLLRWNAWLVLLHSCRELGFKWFSHQLDQSFWVANVHAEQLGADEFQRVAIPFQHQIWNAPQAGMAHQDRASVCVHQALHPLKLGS
jgi:hypothetical protein